MPDNILIGEAYITNKQNEKVKVKIYMGNIVELPDGTQRSLPREIYNEALKRYEEKLLTTPNSTLEEETKEIETDIPDEDETEDKGPHIHYLNKQTGTISDVPPDMAEIEQPESETEKDKNVEDTTDINTEENKDIAENPDNIENSEDENREENPKEDGFPEKNAENTAKDKQIKKMKIIIISLVTLFIAVGGFAVAWATDILPLTIKEPIIEMLNSIGGGEQQPQIEKIYIFQAKQEIMQGTVITEELLQLVTVSESQYKQLSSATYISPDGSTATSSLFKQEDKESLIGKFAARDISQGTYISIQDVSSQKVIAEKNYMEVEVDGETYSVAVDANALMGQTRVKIVALVNSDNQEGTIAISLGEFVLEDRTLEDIFDSAGQSILEQLAGGSVEENNN